MTHLMRHTLSRIVAITGAMMVAGCASFKSGSGPSVNPSFDGEGSGIYGSDDGIGGPRRQPKRSFDLPDITPTSAEMGEDEDDVVVLGATAGKASQYGEDSPVQNARFKKQRARIVGGPGDGTVMEPIGVDEPAIIEGSSLRTSSSKCGKGGCGFFGKSGLFGKGGHGNGLIAGAGGNMTGHRKLRSDMGNNPMQPRELRKVQHPIYVVEPPDVLYIEALEVLPGMPIAGERLVRPDGTISLGYYGQISVVGLTLPEIEEKIRKRLEQYIQGPEVYVDVASFNSKVFYVTGQVQQIGRLPFTGNETVLDGILQAGGLTNYADVNKVYLSRPNPGGGCDQVFHVDWLAIIKCGDTRTNYQLLPGDRIYVSPTAGFSASIMLDNYLSPVERVTNLFALFRFAASSNNNN